MLYIFLPLGYNKQKGGIGVKDRELKRLHNHLMATEENTAPNCRVYNGDPADVDLEQYAQQVDTPAKRGSKLGLLVVILLAVAAALYIYWGGVLLWN